MRVTLLRGEVGKCLLPAGSSDPANHRCGPRQPALGWPVTWSLDQMGGRDPCRSSSWIQVLVSALMCSAAQDASLSGSEPQSPLSKGHGTVAGLPSRGQTEHLFTQIKGIREWVRKAWGLSWCPWDYDTMVGPRDTCLNKAQSPPSRTL